MLLGLVGDCNGLLKQSVKQCLITLNTLSWREIRLQICIFFYTKEFLNASIAGSQLQPYYMKLSPHAVLFPDSRKKKQ